jgi:hypothetical protein
MERSLTSIFLDVFDKDKLAKLRLNKEEIEYIQSLLSDNPEIFTKMEAAINDIMKDGKIDIHDIPQIVVLVSTIMHVNFISVCKKVDLLNVIEYMMYTIIESGILPIPPIEYPILEKIISSSIQLLKMQVRRTDSTKYCCFLF